MKKIGTNIDLNKSDIDLLSSYGIGLRPEGKKSSYIISLKNGVEYLFLKNDDEYYNLFPTSELDKPIKEHCGWTREKCCYRCDSIGGLEEFLILKSDM